MKLVQNPQLELAFNFVEHTGKNIFLTGKAGTGKTTFLNTIRHKTSKRLVVLAPTGVAAINAGGVTIHSFFQLPFGPIVPSKEGVNQPNYNSDNPGNASSGFSRLNKTKINIIRSLDLLIIDEISMVRADLLDGIDATLRRYRRSKKPFGGVQLLMIGDIQQLSPVVKDEEWSLLSSYYDSAYFFSSLALKKSNYISLELTQIFRQQDQNFIDLLNHVRENKLTPEVISQLNSRYIPNFQPDDSEGYITLTTHNARAREENEQKLTALKGTTSKFRASVSGNFPEYAYPTEDLLVLKPGAQVMFVKNDPSPDKEFYNGKIGKVAHIDDDVIYVKCKDESDTIAVGKQEWTNARYTLNDTTKEIEEEVVGSFTQYPLKLAWAITIHKSQGLTFEKAIIDAEAAFAFGQVYVALSRCRTLEGMVLSSSLSGSAVKTDHTVKSFTNHVENNTPDNNLLHQARQEYAMELLEELFSFKSLQVHIYHCIKITRDNENTLTGSPVKAFRDMNNEVEKEIAHVAEKFWLQLRHRFPEVQEIETDAFIQERAIKAAAYFQEKLQHHVKQKFNQISLDSDNKQVKKQLAGAFDALAEETEFKLVCMEGLKAGFQPKEYLKLRAKALLDKKEKKKEKTREKDAGLSHIEHKALYSDLREWRNAGAVEKGVPVYMVLGQKAMVEISNTLPVSFKALLEIKGMGKKKVQQYGQEILEIIEEYCVEKNIPFTPDTRMPEPEKKEKKIPSKKITFDLLKAGKNLSEVAAERNLAISTIEAHLCEYVETGELDIFSLIDEEVIADVTLFFSKNSLSTSLTEAKQALDETISYGQIKLVQSYLKHKQEESAS